MKRVVTFILLLYYSLLCFGLTCYWGHIPYCVFAPKNVFHYFQVPYEYNGMVLSIWDRNPDALEIYRIYNSWKIVTPEYIITPKYIIYKKVVGVASIWLACQIGYEYFLSNTDASCYEHPDFSLTVIRK